MTVQKDEMKKKKRTMPDSHGRFFNFYPGSWKLKRLGYILILYSITINIFLDKVEDQLLLKGEEMLETSDTMYERADEYATDAEDIFVGMLQWIEGFDQKQSENYYYDWFSGEYKQSTFRIKSTLEGWIGNAYDRPDFEIPHSAKVQQDIETVRSFGKETKEYIPYFKATATILKWTSIAIWFPILAAAVPWIFLHLTHCSRSEWLITTGLLLLSVIFNAILYVWLNASFDEYLAQLFMEISFE